MCNPILFEFYFLKNVSLTCAASLPTFTFQFLPGKSTGEVWAPEQDTQSTNSALGRGQRAFPSQRWGWGGEGSSPDRQPPVRKTLRVWDGPLILAQPSALPKHGCLRALAFWGFRKPICCWKHFEMFPSTVSRMKTIQIAAFLFS